MVQILDLATVARAVGAAAEEAQARQLSTIAKRLRAFELELKNQVVWQIADALEIRQQVASGAARRLHKS